MNDQTLTAANSKENLLLRCITCTSVIFFALLSLPATAQETTIIDTSNKSYAVVIAGKQYKRSSIHDMFWGSHYRTEWATPVRVKVLKLDSAFGGLTPILKGGGRQTRTLRLQDKKGKQYVLRSIDKTFTKALPPEFQHTFVNSIANDQVSIAHPYSSVTVPPLAEAAKVFHTNPQIVFLPNDKRLGEYREEFANQLYLLEERPAGFQGDAANFGNTEDVDGTEKMLQKVYEQNDHRVDQESFIRARLFDMFLSDWGRHEDQWRWATFKEKNNTIYRPIPRDRDQAYTRFDGALVAFGIKAARLVYLQSVDYTIKDISGYNFQARHLDRLLANEPSLDTWVRIAKELQQSLTDSLIDYAIKQLPAEVYSSSEVKIAEKLKSRRDELVEFATRYYHILAKEVDIPGTEQREVFEVKGINDNEVQVNIYDQTSEGNKKSTPYYSRTFYASETKEIRLYGLDGKDKFTAEGATSKKFNIRMIGGPKKDLYTIASSFNNKINLYDNRDNDFNSAANTRLHLAEDSAIHSYNYYGFKNNFTGLKPGISYSNEDRLFVGLDYRIQRQKWRKTPFAYQHDFIVNYSITQKAVSAKYKGVFNQVAGQWNLGVLADYDLVRDMHFTGIGNNTIRASDERNFYLTRDMEFNGVVTMFRTYGTKHAVSISGFYQSIKILDHNSKYLLGNPVLNTPATFEPKQFAGIKADYNYETIKEKLFPVKGVRFITGVKFTQNLKETSRSLANVSGMFGFYVPLAPTLTLAIKTGAETLTGDAEFYQLSKLGGGNTIRGFLRYRFYGKSSVYNQNELQWNFNFRSYLFNGKMGLVALFDDGRVWQPGEVSYKWHTGYGGGIVLAPFNKISITGTYAISPEDKRINVRVGRLF